MNTHHVLEQGSTTPENNNIFCPVYIGGTSFEVCPDPISQDEYSVSRRQRFENEFQKTKGKWIAKVDRYITKQQYEDFKI